MKRTREKFTFKNPDGVELAGLLEQPVGPVRATALFAHCFTCGKDALAATRISRALAERGFAVLRFDFTGLGGSDGDFANSNFSTNVADIVAAAEALKDHHSAPALLIGHSLGGAAVLAGAGDIPECKAVVTIGAPSDPAHVTTHFGCDLEKIERDGRAEVDIAGRPFTITRQFLEDVEESRLAERIGSLERALLVFHSPVDKIVAVQHAARIFEAARHPKSFVSLDDADHLLTSEADAEYVAATVCAWVGRYLEGAQAEPRPEVESGHVAVTELDHRFARRVYSDTHAWTADEPASVGGRDSGPDPYEHLLAALGTCTSMTLRMYANHKDWPVDDIEVRLNHFREHAEDCENCDDADSRVDVIERKVRITGDLDDAQRNRLLEIADRCPVHRTLTGDIEIR